MDLADSAARSVLVIRALAGRDEEHPVPRWLRRPGGSDSTPTTLWEAVRPDAVSVWVDPWAAARAADLAAGTWTVVTRGDHGHKVVRGTYPGCPDPDASPLTAEEWGVLLVEALAGGAEACALAGDTSSLVEVVALLARWSATDRAMAAGEVSALLAGLQARAVGDDESDSDDAGDPAQPRGPPGRDREIAPGPVRRLVAAPRRETVPWPPPWQWREPRMP